MNFREELDKAVRNHEYFMGAEMSHPLIALAIMSTNRVFDDIRKIDISYAHNGENKVRFAFIPNTGGRVEITFEDGMFLSEEAVRYLKTDNRLRASRTEELPDI